MDTTPLQPTLEEVRALAAQPSIRRVPVKRELFADRITTIEAMRALRAASNHCFLLESAEADQRWGRYSFLGFNPTLEITCLNGQLSIRRNVEGGEPSRETRQIEHPGEAIRQIIAENKSAKVEGFPAFTGGLVGYFSYDYLKYAEPTLRRPGLDREDFLDVDLMLFDQVICFDNYRQKIILIAGVRTDDVEGSYAQAQAKLDEIEGLLTRTARYEFAPLRLKEPLTPQFSTEEFCEKVKTAKRHIFEGDIFQVVPSNPRTAKAEGSLFDTYRVLRGRILPRTCSTSPAKMWKLQAHPLKRWRACRMAGCSPTPWRAPAHAAQPRKRTRPWRRSFLPMKRNELSTICSLTWDATTWVAYRNWVA